MNEQKTQVVKRDEKAIEYIPFGTDSKIRLTIDIVKNTVAIPTKSGKLPNDRDIIKFMMMCQAQRLNPYAGDAYLCGYDGKDGATFSLITAHQALLKRAEVSDFFEGMQSGVIIKGEDGVITEIEGDFYSADQEVIGGWAKVHHAKRKGFPFYRRIRMERFNKGFAQWSVDAAGMICKCAEADALRSAFPTMLGGLYIAGEQNLPIDIGTTVETVVPGRAEKRVQKAGDPVEISPPTRTPQQELESTIIETGFTFDQFRQWADATDALKGVDSMGSFEEVPAIEASRLLRAKARMLIGINGAATGTEGNLV